MRARKTILDDYLREVRPLFAPRPRTFQRTVYRPGELCQFDLWQPREPIAVGHGERRRGWVVVACSGLLARRARARWCSPSRRRICSGASRAVCGRWAGCRGRWSGIARPGCTRATGARRTSSPRSAASWGRLALLRAGRSAGQGRGRARSRAIWRPTSSPAGVFANERDYQHQLDALVRRPTRARTRRCASARSTGSTTEREAMARAAGVPGSRPALGDPGPGRSLPAL